MSLSDWMTATRRRARQQSLRVALEKSLHDFLQGALRRVHWMRYQLLDRGYTVEHAGVEFDVSIQAPLEIERARNLRSETEIADWLFTCFKGGSVFWDIGGYQGHFSLIAAAHGADVVVFEPVASNRERIHENVTINNFQDRVMVKPFALSDSAGEANIDVSAPNQATIGETGKPIKLCSGDEVDAPRPDVVKIDVEGHELAVLDGMVDTLNGVSRIVIEIHDDRDVEPIKCRLKEAGLTVSEIDSPRHQIHIGGYRSD